MSDTKKAFDNEFKRIRPSIIKRDDHTCKKCKRSNNIKLEVHHINGRIDNEDYNLITLCRECHLIAPNGHEFDIWMKDGITGIEYITEKCEKQNIVVSEKDLEGLLNIISDLNRERLRIARERVKRTTGKCEGRNGYNETHPHILVRISQLRRKPKGRGNKRRSYQKVSDVLNLEGLKSITGKTFTRYIVGSICENYKIR